MLFIGLANFLKSYSPIATRDVEEFSLVGGQLLWTVI